MQDLDFERGEMCNKLDTFTKTGGEEVPGAEDMLHQCQLLRDEVQQFQDYLAEQKKENYAELLLPFKTKVKALLKSLEKLSLADRSSEWTLNYLTFTDLPLLIAVWKTAKHCTDVIAFWRRLHYPSGRMEEIRGRLRPRSTMTEVHIVAQGGAEWVYVSNMNQKRLIAMSNLPDPEGPLKLMEEIVNLAASASRVRGKRPKVRLVFTKIQRSGAKLVEDVILRIQALGVTVLTSEDLEDLFSMTNNRSLLPATFQRMITCSFDRQSETLNLDCSILISIVSDNCHGHAEAEDWHNHWLQDQIKMEKKTPLLPSSLWPAMGGRPLRCTDLAVKRTNEIVDQIGTKSEKQRRDCLFEVESTAHWSREQRIEALRALSSHEVPFDLNIPIKVVNTELATLLKQLPPVAESLTGLLSPLNQSVFLYGWAEGITTLSYSHNLANAIEKKLVGKDAGPDIWIFPGLRSLLGNPKDCDRGRITSSEPSKNIEP